MLHERIRYNRIMHLCINLQRSVELYSKAVVTKNKVVRFNLTI